MLFSKSTYLSGNHTGFFFDDDPSAPDDCIDISDADANKAINLAFGSKYDFSPAGELIVTPPPPPSLGNVKNERIADLNNDCERALKQLVSIYPPLEMQTWPNQYAEAVAYTANPAAATPTLSAIAAATGKLLADVAAGVLLKASAYTAASGSIIGKRQALTDQIVAIQAASTNQADIDAAVAAVRAVVW